MESCPASSGATFPTPGSKLERVRGSGPRQRFHVSSRGTPTTVPCSTKKRNRLLCFGGIDVDASACFQTVSSRGVFRKWLPDDRCDVINVINLVHLRVNA